MSSSLPKIRKFSSKVKENFSTWYQENEIFIKDLYCIMLARLEESTVSDINLSFSKFVNFIYENNFRK